jgi:hypothetical protein
MGSNSIVLLDIEREQPFQGHKFLLRIFFALREGVARQTGDGTE